MKAVKFSLLFLAILAIGFAAWYSRATSSSLPEKLILRHHRSPGSGSANSTIRIMTYNLGYLSGMTNNRAVKPPETLFRNHLEQLKNLLTAQTPDIICFQEIDYDSNRSYRVDQHDRIASRFYPWSLKAINWDKKFVPFPYWPPRVWFGRVVSGQSIMSRWEPVSPAIQVLQKVETNPFYYNAFYLDRLLVSATIQHPVHNFCLMNLHAEAFDSLTRNLQLERVYQNFKRESKKQPVILAGDFNATPDSGEPGILLFLNDSTIGCAVRPRRGKPATYPSENPRERIDYIFYSKPDFRETEGRAGDEYDAISDHLPILTSLRFTTLSGTRP